MNATKLQILFDGGCRPTNPGNKYGSWEVLLDTQPIYKESRVEFGWGTNNEAEFEALLAALKWTVAELGKGGFDQGIYTLLMFTDSTIVRNRVQTRRTAFSGQAGSKARDVSQRMGRLTSECLLWLSRFKSWTIEWRGRQDNVMRFGH